MKRPATQAILSWSGGKDSALALYETQRTDDHEVAALLTTITEDSDTTGMHGVRRLLIEQQAQSLGIALETVSLPRFPSNEEYESRVGELLERCKRKGISTAVFGDIHLEDIRKYREERLASIGMSAVFPLWGRDSAELARTFLREGFKGLIVCVDTRQLDAGYAGRALDRETLASLPEGVDPCGENGEFHSFVYDGPNFRFPIACRKGEVVLRDERFALCDLIPEA